jgi:hypothetical protein
MVMPGLVCKIPVLCPDNQQILAQMVKRGPIFPHFVTPSALPFFPLHKVIFEY